MGVPEIAQKVPDRALCLAYLALPEGGGPPPLQGSEIEVRVQWGLFYG